MKRFIFMLVLSLFLMTGTVFASGGNGWYIQNGTDQAYHFTSNPGSGWSFLTSGTSNPAPGVGNVSGTGGTGYGLYQSPISIANGPGALSPSATGGAVNIGSSNPGVNYGTVSTLSPSANAAANGGNAEVVNNNTVETTVRNNNSNVIEKGAVKNTNRQRQDQEQQQKQDQEQQQGQIQGQANNQNIAPTQSVVIETPPQPVGIPGSGVPELNFGNGKMTDVTLRLPKFALWGITLLNENKGDVIMEVLKVNANVPFKELYKEILKVGKVLGQKGNTSSIRLQIIEVESQKTWTSGGSLSGGASGFITGVATAIGGSLVPQVGRTTASFLYHILFVKVTR